MPSLAPNIFGVHIKAGRAGQAGGVLSEVSGVGPCQVWLDQSLSGD